MVVEHDPETRFMFRLILERAGHEIIEATNGEAALGLINPDPLPDLITTDLMMPILNGERLIERLRSEPRTASIPIVVISASPDAARALQDAGLVEAVVIKPFDPIALEACIRTVAGERMRAADQGSQLV
ncbi:MAG: response regulator [Candidatus Dormibacteraceae bacterium]